MDSDEEVGDFLDEVVKTPAELESKSKLITIHSRRRNGNET